MACATRSLPVLVAASAVGSLVLFTSLAHAQITEPGRHPRYTVELEPHFVVQWEYTYGGSDGLGVGGRVSIPVLDNGPITTINNSLAIGVGFDWAHFDDDCFGYVLVNGVAPTSGCTANHFWVPAVAQWNFFFTPVVSAFAELGLAIHHASFEDSCPAGFCYPGQNYTRVRPVFLIGPRFILSDSFAITLRVGVPYLTIGGSFLL